MNKSNLQICFLKNNTASCFVWWTPWKQRWVMFIVVVGMLFPHTGYGMKNTDSVIPPLQITLSSNAQVNGEEIRLSDVADISGANNTLITKLGEISLGKSPRPGKERKFSRNRIHSLILAIIDKSLNANIAIPDMVRVQRAYQQISEASLKQAFGSYVAKSIGGIEMDISRFNVRGNDPLPLGHISLSPINRSKRPIKGAFSLMMAIRVDGKDAGRLTLSGWVNRYEPVVCATRYIPRGGILTNNDIMLKKINVSKAPARLVRIPENAVGKQVKTSLRAGGVVRQSQLESPPMIEKGERVKILAIAGGIKVATLGIAKDEGRQGDQIKVENIASKKLVVGRVTNRSTVEVFF